MFSTWPVDEVIIRDSSKMHCIVFVTKVRT